MITDEISNILWGEKPYQQKARKAFPILVKQAIKGKPITYSDLAKKIKVSNPRNLNYVLGCIGKTIIELRQENKDIPPIQALVISKGTGLPGEGFYQFISLSKDDFKKLDKEQKQKRVDDYFNKIYSYPASNWDTLLSGLKLKKL